MGELKPCPFCGLIPNINVHHYSFGIRHKIICKCGIQTKEYKKLPMAKRAWNRRADND